MLVWVTPPPITDCDNELYWMLAPRTMFWVNALRDAEAEATAETEDET